MANFIMAGALQAVGFILLFSVLSLFLPLMGLLSNAAVGLITLRMGWRRGLFIALISSAVLGGLTLLMQVNPLVGFGFSMLIWLAVILLATLLGSTVSWSKTLTVLLAVSVGAVLLFHMNVSDPVAFWQNQPLWMQFVEVVKNVQMMPEEMSSSEQQKLLDNAASILSGSIAGTVSVLLILSLLIARHWQAMLYNPGGFGAEWRELQLGKPAALLMIAVITLALFSQQMTAINMVFAGLTVFLFQGIALVHGVVALLQQHKAWLIGMYIMLFLMPAHGGILLAAFGIIDSLAGFRSQIKARKR
ncbi:hypothetical protein [Candidatus Thiothrix anitrata]|jgi:hypothetical protein|uniref:DUF2232 domain-containing protein n=1 Tax=Candidatus Thiothrix anitrata TaxID=2823902 RepID=A0ABX7X2V9_9GAMM|nr:hypothetical protein [Candidatus Thiothrix anitrata]QTR50224.1 hypothetical protein J8380_01165 [Candidatus Thiothrix anitrata]